MNKVKPRVTIFRYWDLIYVLDKYLYIVSIIEIRKNKPNKTLYYFVDNWKKWNIYIYFSDHDVTHLIKNLHT